MEGRGEPRFLLDRHDLSVVECWQPSWLNNKESHAVPFAIHSDAPPLREDSTGAIRVGDSHVLLELVIRAFQDGATPEAIVQRYSTLALTDVYTVVAYYLRHQQEVDAYLTSREELADEVRERIEGQPCDLSDIRSRLLARRPA
jgi:uncharacterized protein (DUF433 family)